MSPITDPVSCVPHPGNIRMSKQIGYSYNPLPDKLSAEDRSLHLSHVTKLLICLIELPRV